MGMRAETITAPVKEDLPGVDETAQADRPWIVIVWNDPVNLMAYVTYVFQKLFGYGRAKAHKLMMQVHVEGKSAVWTGPRERGEAYVQALHEYGLWATMQKDE